MLMRKIIIVTVLLVATVISMVVTIKKNQLDVIFQANVAALAQSEKYDAKICYIKGSEGVWELALFCNSSTSTTALYTCPDESYGCKTATSYCIK